MNDYLFLFFLFCLNFVTESLVYCLFVRKNVQNLLLSSLLINAVTWPLANFFYGIYGTFIVIEAFVFLAEIPLIKLLLRLEWRKALVISLTANLTTALLSFLIF